MAKRSLGNIGSGAGELLPILAGFAAGQILTKQLTFLSANPAMGNIIKIGAGLFFSGGKGFVSGLAKGVALQGATGLAMPVLENAGIALLPPGVPARYIAGIPEPGEIETAEPIGF